MPLLACRFHLAPVCKRGIGPGVATQVFFTTKAPHFGHMSKPAGSKKRVEREPRGARKKNVAKIMQRSAELKQIPELGRRTRSTFLR
jgi:hypothetical protein